ncbi:hypothetical protein FQN57_006322 [Myotisia sp. PD_48]|nr:hypothetical protein FQN57_006322 [Myotisia sp. PD_48]
MKFSLKLITLGVLSIPCNAAGPYECGKGVSELPGSAYTLTEGKDYDLSQLSAYFKKQNKIVTVSAVLASGNHKLRAEKTASGWPYEKPLSARRWESKAEGFDDFGTKAWVPQGLTSSADAAKGGKWEGKDAFIVSWHDKDDTSVRVTFVDNSNDKYRHVLLVVPDGKDNFKRLAIHAGGIMWYGNTLWVVDTDRGIRVFDLNNIWRVESGDGVGKKAGGGYSAQGYEFVIPQIRAYHWTPDQAFKFSWISLDRQGGGDTLMVGEFRDSNKYPIRFVKWPLDATTQRLKMDSKKVAVASWAYCVGILRVQGAVSHGKDIYISRSGLKRGPSDLFTWKSPAKSYKNNAGFLPPGPEDLTFNPTTNTFATVTEFPNKRWILTYKASQPKW